MSILHSNGKSGSKGSDDPSQLRDQRFKRSVVLALTEQFLVCAVLLPFLGVFVLWICIRLSCNILALIYISIHL